MLYRSSHVHFCHVANCVRAVGKKHELKAGAIGFLDPINQDIHLYEKAPTMSNLNILKRMLQTSW